MADCGRTYNRRFLRRVTRAAFLATTLAVCLTFASGAAAAGTYDPAADGYSMERDRPPLAPQRRGGTRATPATGSTSR